MRRLLVLPLLVLVRLRRAAGVGGLVVHLEWGSVDVLLQQLRISLQRRELLRRFLRLIPGQVARIHDNIINKMASLIRIFLRRQITNRILRLTHLAI